MSTNHHHHCFENVVEVNCLDQVHQDTILIHVLFHDLYLFQRHHPLDRLKDELDQNEVEDIQEGKEHLVDIHLFPLRKTWDGLDLKSKEWENKKIGEKERRENTHQLNYLHQIQDFEGMDQDQIDQHHMANSLEDIVVEWN